MISGPFGADGHEPDRGTWDCALCGTPFPCDPAREALRNSLDPIQVAMWMWDALEAAIGDLGDLAPPSGELFERFLQWTRPHPEPEPIAQPVVLRGYRMVVHTPRQREDEERR